KTKTQRRSSKKPSASSTRHRIRSSVLRPGSGSERRPSTDTIAHPCHSVRRTQNFFVDTFSYLCVKFRTLGSQEQSHQYACDCGGGFEWLEYRFTTTNRLKARYAGSRGRWPAKAS